MKLFDNTVSCPINSGKQEKEEMDQSYKERPCANDTTIKEKGIS